MTTDDACIEAAELIAQADGLLITAGAGMGIDSGMPDFRGENGFWKAYPALRGLGMRFHEIANPKAFHTIPTIAWGFYGHRLALYRNVSPHAGFDVLKDIASKIPNGAFVFTSNVDGHFQKAGYLIMVCWHRSTVPAYANDRYWPATVVGRLSPFCGPLRFYDAVVQHLT